MKNSDSIKHIIPALLEAQKAIEFAVKDATNPHFRSKYADLPAVIDAIKKPLNDNGIVFSQIPADEREGYIGVETILLHTSGEWISGTAHCPIGNKQDPQGYGSALTYLRRYSLGAIVGLYSDTDDDGNAASQKPANRPAVKPVAITPASIAIIERLFTDAATANKGAEALASRGRKSHLELTEEEAQKFITFLSAKPETKK